MEKDKAITLYRLYWLLPTASVLLGIVSVIIWNHTEVDVPVDIKIDRASEMVFCICIFTTPLISLIELIVFFGHKRISAAYIIIAEYIALFLYICMVIINLFHSRQWLLLPSAKEWLQSIELSNKLITWLCIGVNFLCMGSFLTEVVLKIKVIRIWSFGMALFYLLILVCNCLTGNIKNYVVLEQVAAIIFHCHLAFYYDYVKRALEEVYASDEKDSKTSILLQARNKASNIESQTVGASTDDTKFHEKESYVFISYSSKNQTKADATRMLLKKNQIPCWMAPYDIPAGSQYAHVINDALENCSCLLLLLTNDSQSSQFVEREVERAITYKKSIVTMQLEDIVLNSGFKFYIGDGQIVPVREIDQTTPEMKRVLEGLCAFLNIERP